MVGGTHCSFSLVQAEQGQVLVVAASHLILRRLQPSQARITRYCLSVLLSSNFRRLPLTFQPLVSIVLVHKNIVWRQSVLDTGRIDIFMSGCLDT